MGWSIVASIVSFAFQAIKQRRAAKKQKERQKKMQEEAAARADAAKGISVVAEGEASPLKVIYGRNLVGGVRVFHSTGNSFSYIDQGFSSGTRGEIFNNGLGASASGRKHEFLFVQQALAFGPIHRCLSVDVDSVIYSDPKFNTHGNDEPDDGVDDGHGGLQVSIFYDGNVVDPMISGNIGGDRNSAYFTNVAYSSAVFRLNRDDPQFSSVPLVQFYVEGLLVYRLTKSGSNYVLAPEKSYSNNPAHCLLDYLTNSVYGRGLSLDSLDLESFYNAALLCDKVVMPSVPPDGRFWKSAVVALTTNASANTLQFSNIANGNANLSLGMPIFIRTAGGGLLANTTYYIKEIVNPGGILATVKLSSSPALTDTVTMSNSTSAVMYQTRQIRLFECNVGLDTTKPIRDNIEVLLESMGLAELIWTGGKYKLMLAYPRVHKSGNVYEQDDLLQYSLSPSDINIFRNTVPSNTLLPPGNGWYEDVSISIDDDDIIRGEEISISWPNASSRFNAVTVKYRNESYDFVEDTVTWPNKSNRIDGANINRGEWSAVTAYNKSDTVTYGGSTYQLVFGKDRVMALAPSSDPLWVLVNFNDVYRQYLEEDSLLPLETEFFEEAATSYYHALAKAEQRCRSSRANTLYKFTVARRLSNLEPGDFIKVSSEVLGIPNDLLRVEEVDINDKGHVVVEAYKFDANFLAWNIGDNENVTPRVMLSEPIGQATNLVFSPASVTTTSIGTLSWDSADDVRVIGYLVKYTTTPIGSVSMSTQWIELGYAGRNSFEIPSLPTAVYTFTVVARTRSEFAKRENWPVISSSVDAISFSSAMALPISIYKRAVSTPTTPTGGVFTFATLSLSTVPAGWSAGIPTGNDTLFVSRATAFSPDGLGVDNTLTWSDPERLNQGVIRVTVDRPVLFVLRNGVGNYGYDDAYGNMSVKDGDSDITTNAAVSYSIQSQTDCTATVDNTNTPTKGHIAVSNLVGGKGYLIVRATYLGLTFDTQITIESVSVDDTVDLTPPPALTGVTITPGFSNFYISVPAQTYVEGGGHDKTVVYSTTTPGSVFADATLLCEFEGTLEAYPATLGVTRYFWFKNKSKAGVLSTAEYGGTNGISATTGKIGATDLNPLIIEAQHLADGSVVAGKLAANSIAVGSAAIQNGAITNAMIADLTADKILSGTIQAAQNIDVGSNLRLSGDGWIESYSGSGFTHNADYARISSGEVSLYKYVPALGTAVKYSYLSRLENGVATNNTSVILPGYWKVQPKIIVSPAVLSLYNPTYSAQPQSIACLAQNIVETSAGSMQYQFTPVAQLQLASNSGSTVYNASSGAIAANSYTTANYTTPANCTSITVNVKGLSVRGNGLSQYFYRQVKYRVEYYNGSTWVTTDPLTTITIGAQTTTDVASNKTFTFPSAGAWQWRVYYEASDVSTSVFGSVAYNYAQDTVNAVASTCPYAGWEGAYYPTVYQKDGVAKTGLISFNAYSLPGGWEIYQKIYNWVQSYDTWVGSSSNTIFKMRSSLAGKRRDYPSITGSESYGTTERNADPYDRVAYSMSHTVSGSSMPTTFNDLNYSVSMNFAGSSSGVTVTGLYHNISCTVYRRQPIANSTTPVNTYKLDSYNYALTSAQVLATGTLNWIAIGE